MYITDWTRVASLQSHTDFSVETRLVYVAAYLLNINILDIPPDIDWSSLVDYHKFIKIHWLFVDTIEHYVKPDSVED